MTDVIFRKDGNEILAFILEAPANYGYIVCLDKVCGHGSASIEYYWKTKPATPEEYEDLKWWMEHVYEYTVNPRRRLTRKDLDTIWEKGVLQ